MSLPVDNRPLCAQGFTLSLLFMKRGPVGKYILGMPPAVLQTDRYSPTSLIMLSQYTQEKLYQRDVSAGVSWAVRDEIQWLYKVKENIYIFKSWSNVDIAV